MLPDSTEDLLKLRPLSGSEEDGALIHLALESDLAPAQFPRPEAKPEANQAAALLLQDAVLMSLRRGAGPFRSFGNLAFEPRAYQLVPLLMALRQDPVRLLIGDDVGIGKTIEAGLIARELLDRGEIGRFSVLCPPHLVDQWVLELEQRFHLRATAVTAGSAARLERGLPVNESIFTLHPFTVVSLDYIKSERRRDDFARACPEMVIVDEAHSCTNPGGGRHLRYELLRALCADKGRHFIMLTATPHSGHEEAFYRLLGLLDSSFERLADASGGERERLREQLAKHFVQRRRSDIDEWKDDTAFPQREIAELTYRLTGKWDAFFRAVLAYCADVTVAAGGDERRQRLTFWGVLALMRCVSSSPGAAAQALRTRMAGQDAVEHTLADSVFDGVADDLSGDDVEPAVGTDDARLQALIDQAEALAGTGGDPKLALLVGHVRSLVDEGFAPVVFCRYIATAHYVAEHLKAALAGVAVAVVTGEWPPEERERRVADAVRADRRVLVATDCLSEGVNLQDGFSAVIHYDLSWNPTRHEQREGRVDRFGQRSPVVRATLIYGENNPVDGAVLQVIIRKAESIRRDLGVPVPLPDDEHSLTQALMRAVMLRGAEARQGDLFAVEDLAEAKELDVQWSSLAERARRNRTVFAQRRLKPDEVIPEWRRMQAALGEQADVGRFVRRAMSRLNARLEEQNGVSRGALTELPEFLQERLAAQGLEGDVAVSFTHPPRRGARFVHRSDPLVATLAEEILERSIAAGGPADGLAAVGRAGVWRTAAVQAQTMVLLLRLRHQLVATTRGRSSVLLVEEALPLAAAGLRQPVITTGPEVLSLLAAPALGDLPEPTRDRLLATLLDRVEQAADLLEEVSRRQAEALLADHRRVRTAAEARGRYEVTPLDPVDVIGAFLLLPPEAV